MSIKLKVLLFIFNFKKINNKKIINNVYKTIYKQTFSMWKKKPTCYINVNKKPFFKEKNKMLLFYVYNIPKSTFN